MSDLNLGQLEEKYEKEVTTIVQKSGTLLRSKYGIWFLGIISFADSALGLPIITDPFMVAYIMADRSKAILGVLVTTLSSVLGGVMMYVMAAFFIDQLLAFFSPESVASFKQVVEMFDQGTFTLALLGAVTPIPYTFVALVAGALKGNLLMFILGSIIGRSIRFGIVGYFTYYFGERAIEMAKKNLKLFSLLAIVVGGAYLFYKLFL